MLLPDECMLKIIILKKKKIIILLKKSNKSYINTYILEQFNHNITKMQDFINIYHYI